jgi:hypothetical protein
MIDFFKRLDKYFVYKCLNDNKITLQTGISNGLIGKARKRGAISQENISKILHTYDELNANWLFTGEGEMLKSEVKETVSVTYTENDSLKDIIIASQAKTIAGLEREMAIKDELIAMMRGQKLAALNKNFMNEDAVEDHDKSGTVTGATRNPAGQLPK